LFGHGAARWVDGLEENRSVQMGEAIGSINLPQGAG